MFSRSHKDFDSTAADAVALGKTTVLDFESVDTGTNGGVFMPAGYGGLTWSSGWAVADPSVFLASYPTSGYFKGTTSGDQVAFNSGGVPVEITATSFNLKSVEMTAGWDKHLDVEIVAYKHGTVVYDETVTLNDKKPLLVEFNLKGIDDITFTPNSDTEVHDRKQDGAGTYMVFDDMSVAKVKSSAGATSVDDHKLAAIFATGGHAVDGHPPVMHADLIHGVHAIV